MMVTSSARLCADGSGAACSRSCMHDNSAGRGKDACSRRRKRGLAGNEFSWPIAARLRRAGYSRPSSLAQGGWGSRRHDCGTRGPTRAQREWAPRSTHKRAGEQVRFERLQCRTVRSNSQGLRSTSSSRPSSLHNARIELAARPDRACWPESRLASSACVHAGPQQAMRGTVLHTLHNALLFLTASTVFIARTRLT
jgi:hypothetical protein